MLVSDRGHQTNLAANFFDLARLQSLLVDYLNSHISFSQLVSGERYFAKGPLTDDRLDLIAV